MFQWSQNEVTFLVVGKYINRIGRCSYIYVSLILFVCQSMTNPSVVMYLVLFLPTLEVITLRKVGWMVGGYDPLN